MMREFLIKVAIPDWATCYTIDGSGDVYYHENKPDYYKGGFIWISKGRIEFSGVTLNPRLFGDWRKTLHEIID
jgi:hypothetical protein